MDKSYQYYQDLANAIDGNNLAKAHEVVMIQLGTIIANKREDFVESLITAGVNVGEDPRDIDLIEAMIDNVDNDNMLLNMALLVNHNNQVTNFDGEGELSDAGVKATYKTMAMYFDNTGQPINDDIPEGITIGERTSNGWGDFAKSLVDTGKGIYDDVNSKKNAGSAAIEKAQASRNAIAQSIIAQRQATIEANTKKKIEAEKTQRTVVLASLGAVSSIFLLAGLYFMLRKKK